MTRHTTNTQIIEIDPNDYQTRRDILLSMWMDNILTDKQYYSIREKLDRFEAERRKREELQ